MAYTPVKKILRKRKRTKNHSVLVCAQRTGCCYTFHSHCGKASASRLLTTQKQPLPFVATLPRVELEAAVPPPFPAEARSAFLQRVSPPMHNHSEASRLSLGRMFCKIQRFQCSWPEILSTNSSIGHCGNQNSSCSLMSLWGWATHPSERSLSL